jgi:hypothetical protein
MSDTNEPAFDWSQAASLLGDDPNSVDADMVAIVKELVEGAELQFQDLKSKNPETDQKGVSSVAHALRGCLLNFGFTEVGTILVQVEKNSYQLADYLARVDQAETAFITSKKMLGARYPVLELL